MTGPGGKQKPMLVSQASVGIYRAQVISLRRML